MMTHLGYLIAAYGASVVVFAIMITWTAARARTVSRQLAQVLADHDDPAV